MRDSSDFVGNGTVEALGASSSDALRMTLRDSWLQWQHGATARAGPSRDRINKVGLCNRRSMSISQLGCNSDGGSTAR